MSLNEKRTIWMLPLYKISLTLSNKIECIGLVLLLAIAGCSEDNISTHSEDIIFLPYYQKCNVLLSAISQEYDISIKTTSFIELGEMIYHSSVDGFISLTSDNKDNLNSAANRIAHNCFPVEFIQTDITMLGFRALREEALTKTINENLFLLYVDKNNNFARLYY
jgi:hypothetical protein